MHWAIASAVEELQEFRERRGGKSEAAAGRAKALEERTSHRQGKLSLATGQRRRLWDDLGGAGQQARVRMLSSYLAPGALSPCTEVAARSQLQHASWTTRRASPFT